MSTGKSLISIFVPLVALLSVSHGAFAQNFSDKIQSQSKASAQFMLKNISRPDTLPGVVVAAPSKQNPDYYFHWVRDAALTIDQVLDLYQNSRDPQYRTRLMKLVTDFVSLSRKNQLTPNRSGGLGEPKFNVDGSAFTGDWGRPQNDGPALRAIALIRLAEIFLKSGQEPYVRKVLYDGRIPTDSVIKSDLEYVAHHWNETSYDLWEEVKGFHFYTLMVQRKSMIWGARLAQGLGDGGAASFYLKQASLIENALRGFLSRNKGYLVATVGRDGGIDYKTSGLDAAVILGALHGYVGNSFLSPGNDLVLATAQRLRVLFQKLYPINQNQNFEVAIGRYPEDRYTGHSTDGEGNPWVLITNAFGELYYRTALELLSKGKLVITQLNLEFYRSVLADPTALQVGQVLTSGETSFKYILQGLSKHGDQYLARTIFHANADGSLSEQISRHNGYMQGASNLTWSHASFISATNWKGQLARTLANRYQ